MWLGMFCAAAPVFAAKAWPVAGVDLCLNKSLLDDLDLAGGDITA